jgi:hypothetical protein
LSFGDADHVATAFEGVAGADHGNTAFGPSPIVITRVWLLAFADRNQANMAFGASPS